MSDSETKDMLTTSEQVDAAAAAAASLDASADADQDAEIEAMRARLAEMEEEARKMSEAAGGVGAGAGGAASATGAAAASGLTAASGAPTTTGTGRPILSPEQIADQDSRSIHVAQVDYSVTEEELKQLFEACGSVNRVTILKDKFSGQPKGFAYVEFKEATSIDNAMILNETEFKGRTLKITAKRTNIPGLSRGGRGGRGRGGRGGPRGGGGGSGSGSGGAGFTGQPGQQGTIDPSGYGPIRGGRGGRGRGRGGYHPYQQSYQY